MIFPSQFHADDTSTFSGIRSCLRLERVTDGGTSEEMEGTASGRKVRLMPPISVEASGPPYQRSRTETLETVESGSSHRGRTDFREAGSHPGEPTDVYRV